APRPTGRRRGSGAGAAGRPAPARHAAECLARRPERRRVTRAVTPLEEIEQVVRARAAAASIDVASPEGEGHLRALIDRAIREWSEDHRRGHRPHDLPDPAGVAERAFRNLARYGPLTQLLEDDDVWEIMVNAPDAIFVRRHSGGSRFHDEVFHDDDHVARTVTKPLEDSSTPHPH